MMSILSDFETVLHQDFKCERLRFEEQAEGMRVGVDGSGCKYIVYKYDKQLGREYKGGLFPFFAKNEGVCSVCDYIVLAVRANRLYCLLIELKRGKKQTFPQLLAAREFVKYVTGTVNRVCKKNYDPVIRLITIRGIDLRKKGTIEKGVTYDECNHHVLKSHTMKLRSFLS